jgi:hypothetical protein
MLMQLDDLRPDDAGRMTVVGDTVVMYDVVRDGAREALQRLHDAHDHYRKLSRPLAADALLEAAETATAWLVTLTRFDRVDRGPEE